MFLRNEKGTICLGNKSAAYFTESEMLNGYDLNRVEFSITEKLMYDQRA